MLWAHGFREDFLSFFQYKSMGALYCHNNQSSNPISPLTIHNLIGSVKQKRSSVKLRLF